MDLILINMVTSSQRGSDQHLACSSVKITIRCCFVFLSRRLAVLLDVDTHGRDEQYVGTTLVIGCLLFLFFVFKYITFFLYLVINYI